MTSISTARLFALGGLSALALTAAACQKPAAQAPAAARPTPPASTPAPLSGPAALPAVADADVKRLAPLPAPEYFETLTEAAFTATPAELDAAIARARAGASRDGRRLPPAAMAELVHDLDAVARARAANNRADLAIASIEAYRLFVSAGISVGAAPAEVSLLDYAGFRYGADLAASPARWADARTAAEFAATQWAALSPRITDPALKAKFGATVAGLKTAADGKDAAQAARINRAELDQVDELETFFAHA